jgi:hypothetical protein
VIGFCAKESLMIFFVIGRRAVVVDEQNRKDRAEYVKHLLAGLSKTLTQEFGKGFLITNIQ